MMNFEEAAHRSACMESNVLQTSLHHLSEWNDPAVTNVGICYI